MPDRTKLCPGETYRWMHRLLLGVMLFLALLICLVFFLTDIEVCWMQAKYNKPCVLCGCTRDVMGLFQGQMPVHHPASLYIFIGLMVETLFRLVGSIFRLPTWVMIVDIVLHGNAAFALLVANVIHLSRNGFI